LGRGNQINTKSDFFQAIRTIKNDQKKITPTTLPESKEKQTQNSGEEEGVYRTISAPFPHLLRRFSAILCGKGVEKVRKFCGKWGEYLPMVY
jgi:hypothetical protein